MIFFFFKQKTAYEMRISDWSSDVCSSDLPIHQAGRNQVEIHLRTRRSVAARRGRIGRHEAAPVDQRQCPLRAETEHIDETLPGEIGRASCRERVCQYV